jgi:hypothetical protein
VALLPPGGIGEFRFVESSIALSAIVKSIASPSPNRVVLILSCPAGTISVGTNPGILNATGFQLVPTVPPLIFNWHDVATVCSQQWYGISTGGGTCTVIEVFYTPHEQRGIQQSGNPEQTGSPSISAHRKS